MRATLYGGPGDISVGERPDPVVGSPTDAVVRVALDAHEGLDERRAVTSLLRIGSAS